MPWFRKSEIEKQLEQAIPISPSAYIQMFNEPMGPFAEFSSFNHWLFSLNSQEERRQMSDRAWNAIWDRVDADLELKYVLSIWRLWKSQPGVHN